MRKAKVLDMEDICKCNYREIPAISDSLWKPSFNHVDQPTKKCPLNIPSLIHLRIFGSAPSDIVITRVKGGSTVVGWSNDTLPYNPCPIDQVNRLKDVVFDEHNKIKNSVIKPMAENEFILNKVSSYGLPSFV